MMGFVQKGQLWNFFEYFLSTPCQSLTRKIRKIGIGIFRENGLSIITYFFVQSSIIYDLYLNWSLLFLFEI